MPKSERDDFFKDRTICLLTSESCAVTSFKEFNLHLETFYSVFCSIKKNCSEKLIS